VLEWRVAQAIGSREDYAKAAHDNAGWHDAAVTEAI
jgi:hypothetical protein